MDQMEKEFNEVWDAQVAALVEHRFDAQLTYVASINF